MSEYTTARSALWLPRYTYLPVHLRSRPPPLPSALPWTTLREGSAHYKNLYSHLPYAAPVPGLSPPAGLPSLSRQDNLPFPFVPAAPVPAPRLSLYPYIHYNSGQAISLPLNPPFHSYRSRSLPYNPRWIENHGSVPTPGNTPNHPHIHAACSLSHNCYLPSPSTLVPHNYSPTPGDYYSYTQRPPGSHC